jgi:hypothetical protein
MDEGSLPDGRVVVEFLYGPPERFQGWIVCDRGDVSMCSTHPGFDSDLLVRADKVAMARVFNGTTTLQKAVDEQKVELLGPPGLVKGFSKWFLMSPFNQTARARFGVR